MKVIKSTFPQKQICINCFSTLEILQGDLKKIEQKNIFHANYKVIGFICCECGQSQKFIHPDKKGN